MIIYYCHTHRVLKSKKITTSIFKKPAPDYKVDGMV